MWNSSLKYVSKCVEPLAECKSEFTIFQELAKLMGLNGYPDLTTTAWLTRAAAKLAVYNLSFTALQKKGYLDSPLQKQVPWADYQFRTPDGKFQCLDKEQLPQPQQLPLLYLHPTTARRFGVTDGQQALAVANNNSLKVMIAVTEKASPFAAYMRQGVSKHAGGPVNSLTPAGVTDIGNQALLNEVSITLRPLTEADTDN
jgi:anaerobic selenocysteine-containing dehydrogenase